MLAANVAMTVSPAPETSNTSLDVVEGKFSTLLIVISFIPSHLES